jgi:hypothetical protein
MRNPASTSVSGSAMASNVRRHSRLARSMSRVRASTLLSSTRFDSSSTPSR